MNTTPRSSVLRTPTPIAPVVVDEYGDAVASLAVVLDHMQTHDLTVAEVLGLVADPDHDWGTTP